MPEKQLGFHIDQASCIGCFTCQIACKDKNDLEVGQLWRRVVEMAGGGYVEEGNTVRSNVFAYYIPVSCNHCADPPCVRNCPTGALYKREKDGLVLLNQDRCIGCQYCVWSCPYNAPQFNPATGKVGKCNFCVDLLEQGKDPVCVSACPMRALHWGPIDELKQKYGGVDLIRGLPDPKLTGPSLLVTPHRDAIK
ncbi:MAG: dimethylsulfoxide reductase subunit B [Clostridia bacterium]|nr:dimethylsulfoxide reductase subunit B [Clostridia bacterium]